MLVALPLRLYLLLLLLIFFFLFFSSYVPLNYTLYLWAILKKNKAGPESVEKKSHSGLFWRFLAIHGEKVSSPLAISTHFSKAEVGRWTTREDLGFEDEGK